MINTTNPTAINKPPNPPWEAIANIMPIMMNKNPKPCHFPPVRVTLVCDCGLSVTEGLPDIGAPQLGHEAALSDISLPHSAHEINATMLFLVFFASNAANHRRGKAE